MKARFGLSQAAFLTLSMICPLSFSFAQASPSPSASATSTAIPGQVATASGSLGTYLSDSQGRSLYLFEADTSNTSTCTGACAIAWPPFLIPNGQTPDVSSAATSVQSSLLATTTRPDGTTQVTYNGHPVYYFAGDVGSGATNGQGLNQFGALWYLVQPSGQPLIQATGSASPSPSAAPPAAPPTTGSPY